MEIIRDKAGLKRHDGAQSVVGGCYRSIARPIPGAAQAGRTRDHAVIELVDTTRVFLEPFDSPEGRRPEAERTRFDGKPVRVHGTVHDVMPAKGQSPLAPCVAGVTRIEDDLEA